MILAETIFVNQQPVGVVRQDSDSGLIDFSPTDGKSLIQDRNWSNVDELRAAVQKAYSHKEKSPRGLTSGLSYALDEHFTKHAHHEKPD